MQTIRRNLKEYIARVIGQRVVSINNKIFKELKTDMAYINHSIF